MHVRPRRHRERAAPRRRTVGAGNQVSSVVTPWAWHQSPNPTTSSSSSCTASSAKRSSRGRRWAVSSSSGDVGAHALGESVAAGRTAEVEVVGLLRAPDDADLGRIRPGAAVRAAGHVEADRLTLVAGVGEQLLELVDHRRQHPLGLAQRLSARRQCGAGDRQPSQRAHVVGQRDVVVAQHGDQRVAVTRHRTAGGPGGA